MAHRLVELVAGRPVRWHHCGVGVRLAVAGCYRAPHFSGQSGHCHRGGVPVPLSSMSSPPTGSGLPHVVSRAQRFGSRRSFVDCSGVPHCAPSGVHLHALRGEMHRQGLTNR